MGNIRHAKLAERIFLRTHGNCSVVGAKVDFFLRMPIATGMFSLLFSCHIRYPLFAETPHSTMLVFTLRSSTFSNFSPWFVRPRFLKRSRVPLRCVFPVSSFS